MPVRERPTFLWEYDLSADDVRRILATGTAVEQRWLVERILMQARWNEIWDYLTPQQISGYLPDLKLPANVKGTWARALDLWSVRASLDPAHEMAQYSAGGCR